jgi:hypothetical protein
MAVGTSGIWYWAFASDILILVAGVCPMQSVFADPVYDPNSSDTEETMAVTEKRVHAIESELGQIAQRLAKLEGHKEASAIPRQSPNTVLIAVLSALGIAVIWYWGWIGTQVVAQGKQISQILALLSPEQIIKNASLRPNDSQSTKQVEQAVRKAVKQGERIDANVVSQAGAKFVDAATTAPDAWNAAVALLDYKSFLNVDAPTPEPTPDADRQTFNVRFNYLSLTKDEAGSLEWLGIAHPPNLPELHSLGAADENANSKTGPAFLLIKNAQLFMGNMVMKNIIIQDSHVVYRGDPIELENVYFVNCTFDVRREVRGQQFAKAIFSTSPAITFTAG